MTSLGQPQETLQSRAARPRALATCLVIAAVAGSTTSLRAQPPQQSQPGIRIDRFEPAWTGSTSTAAAPSIVYQHAIGEGMADDKWNVRRVVTAPGGQSFLGRFGNEAVTLNLASLPEHTHPVLAFDLSIIGDWRGGAGRWTGDRVFYRARIERRQ